MKPHIAIIGVGVRDPNARGFYRDGLHWPILQEQGEGFASASAMAPRRHALPLDQLADGADVPAEGSGFRGITFSYTSGRKTLDDVLG